MIHYKGSTTTTKRDIPKQTAEEKRLQDRYDAFATSSMSTADNLVNRGYNALNGTVNLDFNNMLGNYNNAMTGINHGYQNMANGILPTQFATARQNALNTDLNATVGSAINSLGNRGVLNSSVTGSALNNITRNASDTLARNYTSDLGTYGNILNNQQSSMGNALNTNILGQQASFYPAQQYMNMGYNAASPLQNLFNTMYSGRMGTAGSTTTETPSTMDTVSSIASIALMACFAAGTKIATPDGDVNIEDIKVGMKVLSLDNENNVCVETVGHVCEPRESVIMRMDTEKASVKTTETQRFIVDGEPRYARKLITDVDEIIMQDGVSLFDGYDYLPSELVYDFAVSGRNIFFANNLAAEGWD